MPNLIEKFYAGSPGKRLFTVFVWLVIISVASTVYSFINLASQLKMLNEFTPSEKIGFENWPNYLGHKYVDEPLKKALKAWVALAGVAEKFVVGGRGMKEPLRLADGIDNHDEEIVIAIQNIATLDWKYILLFVSPQLDPLNTKLAEDFRKIRLVSRFLVLYHQRYAKMNPDKSSAFIFDANVRVGRMNDFSSPFIIGKMITSAIDGIAMKGLVSVTNSIDISRDEAVKYIDALHSSIILDKPLRTSIEDEFIFFKHVYGRLFAQAPLATWIMEKFYGDPFAHYKEYNMKMLEDPNFKIDTNPLSQNPILAIAIPNFRRANFQVNEKLCQRAVLIATLADKHGIEAEATDYWSGEPIKSVSKNGQKIFYSVGPDKVDNSGEGDDILLPTDLSL